MLTHHHADHLDQAIGYLKNIFQGSLEISPFALLAKILFEADLHPLSNNTWGIYTGATLVTILKIAVYVYKINYPETPPTQNPGWVKWADALFSGSSGFAEIALPGLLANFIFSPEDSVGLKYGITTAASMWGAVSFWHTARKISPHKTSFCSGIQTAEEERLIGKYGERIAVNSGRPS